MKTLIISLLFALNVWALNETVSGTGRSGGYCTGGGFNSICRNQLEDQAERDAERDGDMQCRLRQGNLLPYGGYCNTSCFPNYIDENESRYVSCTAYCNYTCDVRRP